MKLYFAGFEKYILLTDEGLRPKIKNGLVSYFSFRNLEKYKKWSEEGINIFLDSGAFSAWSQQKEINIDEYIDFLFLVKDYVNIYVALDSIGDGCKSLENYKYMKEKGLEPIPCFHYGENFEILDYYVKHSEYVGLGGMVGLDVKGKIKWLNRIFSVYPNHKFHGFGQTAYNLFKKYPWYSLDSTSWVQGSKFGRVLLPSGLTIDLSNKNLGNHSAQLKAIKKYYPHLNINKLKNNYKYRNSLNVLTFLGIEKEVNNFDTKFKNIQKTLF